MQAKPVFHLFDAQTDRVSDNPEYVIDWRTGRQVTLSKEEQSAKKRYLDGYPDKEASLIATGVPHGGPGGRKEGSRGIREDDIGPLNRF